MVWVIGAVCVVVVMSTAYAILVWTVKRCPAAPASWHTELRELLREHHMDREISLRVHANLGPFLCRLPLGYCIIVPEQQWRTLSRAQRTAILRHEIAHLRRHDIWVSVVARAIALPQWFNPVAWWVVRRFDEAAEWACDLSATGQNPNAVIGFANALVELAQPRMPRIGVSEARGATVAARVRRLLATGSGSDHWPRRTAVILGVVLLAISGIVQPRFVTKFVWAEEATVEETGSAVASDQEETPSRDAVVPTDSFESRLNGLAEQLAADDSELAVNFRQTLQTPAGRVAVQDQVAYIDSEMRRQARDAAVPAFLDEHFRQSSDGYQLRDEQQDFRNAILKFTEVFDSDVAAMAPTIQATADRLAADSEVNQLLARFLKLDYAAPILYANRLRAKLRPDVTQVAERLSDVLVNIDGRYSIRSGRRDDVEQRLNVVDRASRIVPTIRRELLEYSQEMAETDDRHRDFKRAMAHDVFQAIVSFQLANNDDSIQNQIDGFFQNLEYLTVDSAAGLTLNPETLDQIDEQLANYHRMAHRIEILTPAVKEFAELMRTDDALHQRLAGLLRTMMGVSRIAEDFDADSPDPDSALKDLLGQILQEDAEGRLRVKEEQAEELTNGLREMFRNHREFRRRGRVVDQLAENLDDEALRAALQSIPGKYVVLKMIEQRLASQSRDPFSTWVKDRFESIDGGIGIKDSAAEEIQSIVNQVQEINRELEKDDF
jgi:hypothetical protein